MKNKQHKFPFGFEKKSYKQQMAAEYLPKKCTVRGI